MTDWQPIETAPKDGTDCLFYSPGNPHAGNANARKPYMRVDWFSDRWPRAAYQYPEAPYTLWQSITPPHHTGRVK